MYSRLHFCLWVSPNVLENTISTKHFLCIQPHRRMLCWSVVKVGVVSMGSFLVFLASSCTFSPVISSQLQPVWWLFNYNCSCDLFFHLKKPRTLYMRGYFSICRDTSVLACYFQVLKVTHLLQHAMLVLVMFWKFPIILLCFVCVICHYIWAFQSICAVQMAAIVQFMICELHYPASWESSSYISIFEFLTCYCFDSIQCTLCSCFNSF